MTMVLRRSGGGTLRRGRVLLRSHGNAQRTGTCWDVGGFNVIFVTTWGPQDSVQLVYNANKYGLWYLNL